jgi:adenylosuccinate lyase
MGSLWSDEAKFRSWLQVELAACEVLCERGKVPAEDLKIIREKADFDIRRIDEIETEVKHDVIAFLTAVAEKVGPSSRYIHLGLTSSDVLDTALAIQIQRAMELIGRDVKALRETVGRRARQHRHLVMVGRTHGIHAEPMTFGLKMALWYEDLGRCEERLERVRERMRQGKISGAVGTFAHLPIEVEEAVCARVGLKAAPISTQVLQRDLHADLIQNLALVGAQAEKMAVELRSLQRTDIHEVEEAFTQGQKGSSAMPHKKNPISAENISGLARILRGNAVAALENVALWHERDISHSSVERVIIPDSFILLDYMLVRLGKVIENLQVFPEQMKANLEKMGGLIFSQAVMLRLVESGVTREDAYRMVQRNAMRVWQGEGDLKTLLERDSEVGRVLGKQGLEECFDLNPLLKNVDRIFARVGLD